VLAWVMLVTWAVCPVGAVPEYLNSREPLATSLEEEPSPTEFIGYSPEVALAWEEMRPARLLPTLREEHAPETGHPFFDDARFTVRPRFYYFHREIDRQRNQLSAAAGGSLSLDSGWWRDSLRVGLTGYLSQRIYGPKDRDGLGLLRTGQRSYSALGEAYIELKRDKFRARVGRSRVDMPFINDHDIRMTPNTFEGVGFRTLALPNLQLSMSHLTGIKRRNGVTFESMSEHAGLVGVDRGVTSIAARYNLGDDAYLALVNQYGWDMYNTIYAEAEHLFEFERGITLRMGTQFIDQRSVGNELLGVFSTQSVGAKFALEYAGLIAALSFTWTSEDAGIRNPWGGTPTYHSMMISDFDRAGERSMGIGLTYDFSEVGLKGVSANTSYIIGSTPNSGAAASPDADEFNFTIDYRPASEIVENVWLRFRYAHNNQSKSLGGADITDWRFILNYSFEF